MIFQYMVTRQILKNLAYSLHKSFLLLMKVVIEKVEYESNECNNWISSIKKIIKEKLKLTHENSDKSNALEKQNQIIHSVISNITNYSLVKDIIHPIINLCDEHMDMSIEYFREKSYKFIFEKVYVKN